MEKKISKEQALAALEDLDDFSRMSTSVNPYGPYKALKKFIEQESSNEFKLPTSYKSSSVSVKLSPSVWAQINIDDTNFEDNALTQISFWFDSPKKAVEWYHKIVSDIEETQEEELEKEMRNQAIALIEKHYPEKGHVPFTWAVEAVMEVLRNPNAGK